MKNEFTGIQMKRQILFSVTHAIIVVVEKGFAF